MVWVNSAGNETLDITCCLEPSIDEVLTVTAIADYDGRPGSQAAAQCRVNGDVIFDDGADFGQADDGAAFFSNFATLTADGAHTVSAPGACLRTLFPLFGCGPKAKTCVGSGFYGTSFAAPLASGTVALCIASRACAGLTSTADRAEDRQRRKAVRRSPSELRLRRRSTPSDRRQVLRLPDPSRALLTYADLPVK